MPSNDPERRKSRSDSPRKVGPEHYGRDRRDYQQQSRYHSPERHQVPDPSSQSHAGSHTQPRAVEDYGQQADNVSPYTSGGAAAVFLAQRNNPPPGDQDPLTRGVLKQLAQQDGPLPRKISGKIGGQDVFDGVSEADKEVVRNAILAKPNGRVKISKLDEALGRRFEKKHLGAMVEEIRREGKQRKPGVSKGDGGMLVPIDSEQFLLCDEQGYDELHARQEPHYPYRHHVHTRVTSSSDALPQVAIGIADFPPYDAHFSHVDSQEKDSRDQTQSLESQIQAAGRDGMRSLEVILEGSKQKLGWLLPLKVEDVRDEYRIAGHGVDGLVAVEVRNWLRKEVKTHVTVFEILNGKESVRGVVKGIVKKMVKEMVKE